MEAARTIWAPLPGLPVLGLPPDDEPARVPPRARAGLRHRGGRRPGDAAGQAARRLGRGGDLPLLAAALSIPAEQTAPPPEVDPSMLRVLALHVAAGIVAAHAALLLVEDLHWADESTPRPARRAALGPAPGLLIVLDRARRLRAAVAGAPRPGSGRCRPASWRRWPGRSRRARALARVRAAGPGRPQRRRPAVPRGARARRERRPARVPATDAPARPAHPAALRDPLLARLAPPGVDLELAQIAATIGRDVDRALLQRVAGLDDEMFARQAGQPAGQRPARPHGRADASASGTS